MQTRFIVSKPKSSSAHQDAPRATYYYMDYFGVIWDKAFMISGGNVLYLMSLYVVHTQQCYDTFVYAMVLGYLATLGISGGAHRLWAHKSFKANSGLEFALMIMQTLCSQDTILQWATDHRLHHKWSDTNSDPYNPNRGVFYAHIGWLVYTRHPEMSLKRDSVDTRDLRSNKIVMFQHNYFGLMHFFVGFLLPTMVPVYFWNEHWFNSFLISYVCRSVTLQHLVFLVNSAAHTFGHKPFNRRISPTDHSVVNFMTMGDGYHNYHHRFPHDYKSAELGTKINYPKYFIDLMATFGWAYDRISMSAETVERAKQTELARINDKRSYLDVHQSFNSCDRASSTSICTSEDPKLSTVMQRERA